MTIINETRLQITSVGSNISTQIIIEAIMTLQSAFIKATDSPRSVFAVGRSFARMLGFVLAERGRRRRESEAFHRWMVSEHALQDTGFRANYGDHMLARELNNIPLGYLGFAALIFRNHAGGKAF